MPTGHTVMNMSAIERRDDDGSALEEYPEFELSYLLDDDPDEVTIFPGEGTEDLGTEWVSVDVDAAVALEDAR
ncbi:MAG: hypothetical protein ABEJ79_08715 [Halolamina sp.]